MGEKKSGGIVQRCGKGGEGKRDERECFVMELMCFQYFIGK